MFICHKKLGKGTVYELLELAGKLAEIFRNILQQIVVLYRILGSCDLIHVLWWNSERFVVIT
jgi:hypothetical protein